jgi:hypothetical protein
MQMVLKGYFPQVNIRKKIAAVVGQVTKAIATRFHAVADLFPLSCNL